MSHVRIVLVRHGETQDNRDGIFQGHGGSSLSDRGRVEVQRVAERLAREHPDARLLVRSDLQRVVETASPLQRRLPGAAVRVDPRLREVDFGRWTGLSAVEAERLDPDQYRAWRAGVDVARGGGETFRELRGRVWAAVEDVRRELASAGGGTAVLVTSGGPVRVAVAAAVGLDHGGERSLAPVANGSLTVLVSGDGERLRLHSYNRRAHLDGWEAPRSAGGAGAREGIGT